MQLFIIVLLIALDSVIIWHKLKQIFASIGVKKCSKNTIAVHQKSCIMTYMSRLILDNCVWARNNTAIYCVSHPRRAKFDKCGSCTKYFEANNRLFLRNDGTCGNSTVTSRYGYEFWMIHLFTRSASWNVEKEKQRKIIHYNLSPYDIFLLCVSRINCLANVFRLLKKPLNLKTMFWRCLNRTGKSFS